KAAPDIALVADRAGKPVDEVTATYFATEAFFQLDRVASAVPNIVLSDYFDRLALDRALDSIGDAERRLTAAMVANGHAGAEGAAPPARDDGRKCQRRHRRRGEMVPPAVGGSRTDPLGNSSNCRFRSHIFKIAGLSEPAGRSGAALVPPSHIPRRFPF